MTNNYLSQLLNEFDQEFKSLVIPFTETETYVVSSAANEVKPNFVDNQIELSTNENITANKNISAQKLERIKSLAAEISAERYNHNYNPEVCLANLLNYILSDDTQDMNDDFFQLFNQEHDMNLEQALNDFDFYLNNPYKKKAEKILSKIEARKNK